jgi:UDP-N-acetylmuramyl pentapeptide phosphotransferase/UDP-N-acetylglucosamine-1-phosphate transferase
MSIELFFLTISSGIVLNIILIKRKLFLNLTGDPHQKFVTSKSVPLSGGIVLIFIAYYFIDLTNFIFIFSFFSIFFIGILSDTKKINSPKLRLFLQILIILVCIYFTSIFVSSTDILLLDYFLENFSFQIIFTVFCVLIIINGCNFIDGVNTSLIGYCLIISSALFYLELNGIIVSQIINLSSLIPVLLGIFILNFFNKLYLGDSGSYVLGLSFSIYLIETYQINESMSSLFIISLLWYPAFENLFSILRKIKFSISPIKPDTNHLHQLIFFHLKKFFNSNSFYINTLTGVLINFYNILSIMLATKFFNNTQVQILIIVFNLFFYIFVYSKLNSSKKKKF